MIVESLRCGDFGLRDGFDTKKLRDLAKKSESFTGDEELRREDPG